MLNALSLIFDRAGVETLNRGREVRHVNYLKGDISVGLKIGCELELGPYQQRIMLPDRGMARAACNGYSAAAII